MLSTLRTHWLHVVYLLGALGAMVVASGAGEKWPG